MSGEPRTELKQIIPGYRLDRKLGQGGMGAVFLARQLSMDRLIAVKILPKSFAQKPGFKERFFREARAAGALNHPNIVAAIDCQETDGYCYLAMEYVEGHDPLQAVKQKGPLPERKAAFIGFQIAQALEHAWKAGIVHRDVKPENFLVTADGVAKLCDLGIAQFTHAADEAESENAQAGVAIGTPRYMSPEQAQGLPNTDFRTDIYSLGASLYHLMTGVPPYSGGSSAEIMRQHVAGHLAPPVERNPHLTRHASRVIQKMMAKDPADRYQNAESLLADLDALAKGRVPPGILASVMADNVGGGATAKMAQRKAKAGLPPGVVALVAAVAAVVAYFALRPKPTEDATPPGEIATSVTKAEFEAEASEALAAIDRRGLSGATLSSALRDLMRRYGDTSAAAEARARLVDLEGAGGVEAAPPRSVAASGKGATATAAGKGTPAGEKATTPAAPGGKSPAQAREEKAQVALFRLRQQIERDKMGKLQAERLLREFAHDWDGTDAAKAAMELARGGAANSPPAVKPFHQQSDLEKLRAFDAWRQQLEADEKSGPNVLDDKLKALAELGRIAPIPDSLAPKLAELAAKHPQARVRAAAATALGGLDPKKAEPALSAALLDRNETVRLAAIRGWGRLPSAEGKKVKDRLRAMATSTDAGKPADPSPEIRRVATALADRMDGKTEDKDK